VPDLKMHNILKYLQLVFDNINQLTARNVAAVVGKIIALNQQTRDHHLDIQLLKNL
jgi:hypothetical protein